MPSRSRSASQENTGKAAKRARIESPESARASSPAADNIDSDVEEIAPPEEDSSEETGAQAKLKFNKKWKKKNLSDEQILRAQRKLWKSNVYKHFHPGTITYIDGEVHYKFVCKSNPNLPSLTRVRWDTLTGNLNRHKAQCTKKVAPPGKGINDFAHGSTYSKAHMRYLCALWVTRRHRPYAIVADDELLAIFRMLYAQVEVPHPTTLSRDVKEIFLIAQKNVAHMLQKYDGRLHLCVDGWTSPNVLSFLGVTVHYVTDGRMKSFILDFIRLVKSHTGEYLAAELRACLERYGISKKLLALTADNASNNNTLVVELESLGGIYSAATRVRCAAHILNLVVEAIISPFTNKRCATKAAITEEVDGIEEDDHSEQESEQFSDAEGEGDEDDDEEDEYDVDADRENADDVEIDVIIEEVQRKYKLSGEEERTSRFAVTKLVELAKHVYHSPNLQTDLRTCCEKADISPKEMKRAVPTRWNSLAEAIGRALDLQGGIDALVRLGKYDKPAKGGGLRHLRLNMREWDILKQLHQVLKIFLRATERVSKTNTPLLHEVIPVIDVLTKGLTKTIADATVAQPVRVAAARGYQVVNKYYSLTDDSIMYRAAMIMHPRYKTEYFCRQEWEPEWILTAINLLREQWQKYYRPKPVQAQDAGTTTQSSRSGVDVDPFEELDTWDAPYGDVLKLHST